MSFSWILCKAVKEQAGTKLYFEELLGILGTGLGKLATAKVQHVDSYS